MNFNWSNISAQFMKYKWWALSAAVIAVLLMGAIAYKYFWLPKSSSSKVAQESLLPGNSDPIGKPQDNDTDASIDPTDDLDTRTTSISPNYRQSSANKSSSHSDNLFPDTISEMDPYIHTRSDFPGEDPQAVPEYFNLLCCDTSQLPSGMNLLNRSEGLVVGL